MQKLAPRSNALQWKELVRSSCVDERRTEPCWPELGETVRSRTQGGDGEMCVGEIRGDLSAMCSRIERSCRWTV